MFRLNNLDKSATTNYAFRSMTKASRGRLPIFTTIGGIRSVGSLKATHPPSAFQVCEARSKCPFPGSDPGKLRPLSRPHNIRTVGRRVGFAADTQETRTDS